MTTLKMKHRGLRNRLRRHRGLIRFLLIWAFIFSNFVPAYGFDYTKTQEFENILRRVERWRPLVYESLDTYDVSDHLLVLSVIAQESHGLQQALSQDRHFSVGLMQVTPRPWTGTAAELRQPRYNIAIGVHILDKVLREAEGDTFLALKYYNCGIDRIEINPFCGDYYADLVLNFWYPIFEERWLEFICEQRCLPEM